MKYFYETNSLQNVQWSICLKSRLVYKNHCYIKYMVPKFLVHHEREKFRKWFAIQNYGPFVFNFL